MVTVRNLSKAPVTLGALGTIQPGKTMDLEDVDDLDGLVSVKTIEAMIEGGILGEVNGDDIVDDPTGGEDEDEDEDEE